MAVIQMEVLRRLLLGRLHRTWRLSEDFMRNLLSWVHPGFSVFAGPSVDGAAVISLASQARYITRPALAMDAFEKLDDDRPTLETPPDPRTGAPTITLDPLEWIDRITVHILDPGRHCQRFYGAYSNWRRVVTARPEGDSTDPANSRADQENSESSREARSVRRQQKWHRFGQEVKRDFGGGGQGGIPPAHLPGLDSPRQPRRCWPWHIDHRSHHGHLDKPRSAWETSSESVRGSSRSRDP